VDLGGTHVHAPIDLGNPGALGRSFGAADGDGDADDQGDSGSGDGNSGSGDGSCPGN
jgi:hypothetical protein